MTEHCWYFGEKSEEGFDVLGALYRCKGSASVNLLTPEGTVLSADAEKELHHFALWCAEKTLKLIDAEYKEPLSLTALETKRRWLDGQATEQELQATREAMWADKRHTSPPFANVRAIVKNATQTVATNAAIHSIDTCSQVAAQVAVWRAVDDTVRDDARRIAKDEQAAELERRLLGLFN